MKRIIKICGIIFCIAVCLTFSAYAENVSGNNFTDSEKAAQRDAGFEIWKEVYYAVQNGESYIKIPPGNYRVNNEKVGAFIINGAKNLHIDAEGAVFWSDTNESVFKINNSSGCKINGLTIDYDPIGAIQGTVLSVDEAGKTFDILLDNGCPVPDCEWNKAAADGKMKAIFFDENGEKMIEGQMDYTNSITDKGNGVYAIGLKLNTRFSNSLPDCQKIKAGMRYVSPWRRSTTIELKNSDNMTFEDITVYAASGFAIGENYGEGGNIYRRIKQIRRPGTDRLLASNADGIHSGGVKKGPLIEDCIFSYAGDDLLNIRGFYDVVLEKESGNTFIIGIPEEELNFSPGTELRFFDINNFDKEGSAIVLSVEEYNGETALKAAENIVENMRARGISLNPNLGTSVVPFRCYRVTLSEDVDADIYSIAESKDYCGSGAVVRNNVFDSTVTAGARIRCSDALIENNTFNRCGESAVVIRGERYWLEGGFSDNVIIKNNIISEACCLNPARDNLYSAAISVSASVNFYNSPSAAGNAANIVVIGNKIQKSYGQAALLWDTENVVFDKNIIDNPFYSGSNAEKLDNFGVWIKNCANVQTGSNIYNNVPEGIIKEQKENITESGFAPLLLGAELEADKSDVKGKFRFLSGAASEETVIRARLKDEEGNALAETALKGGASEYDIFDYGMNICFPNYNGNYILSLEAAAGNNILWTKDFNLSD